MRLFFIITNMLSDSIFSRMATFSTCSVVSHQFVTIFKVSMEIEKKFLD